MTDKKMTRRDALATGAGGALSLAAALALVNETAMAADDTYSEPEIVRIASDFLGPARVGEQHHAARGTDLLEHVLHHAAGVLH